MSSLIDPFNHDNYRDPDYNPFHKPSPNDDIVVDCDDDPFQMDEDYDDETLSISETNKFSAVQKELDEAKKIALDNVEKVVHRDEELDRLLDKTENMVSGSFSFKRASKKLKYQLWCDNLQKQTCLILLILCVIGVIVLIIMESTKNK